MHRSQKRASFRRWVPGAMLLVLTSALLPGCGTQESSSLADLISIHNAELDALDRLEKKRVELVKAYQAELMPSQQDAAQLLGDVLQGAVDAQNPIDPKDMIDPNAALDIAVDRAQKTQDAMGQMLQKLSSETQVDEKELQRRAAVTEKYEAELAALDKEIEAQKKRVQRAREARDAAEAKGR